MSYPHEQCSVCDRAAVDQLGFCATHLAEWREALYSEARERQAPGPRRSRQVVYSVDGDPIDVETGRAFFGDVDGE